MFSLIVLLDSRGGIAKNGKIPLNFSKDFEIFKRKTMDNIVNNKNVVLHDKLAECCETHECNHKVPKTELLDFISKKINNNNYNSNDINDAFRIKKENIMKYINEFISEIYQNHNNNDNILITTHNNWLQSFINLNNINNKEYFKNCEIRGYSLTIKNNQINITEFNVKESLDKLGQIPPKPEFVPPKPELVPPRPTLVPPRPTLVPPKPVLVPPKPKLVPPKQYKPTPDQEDDIDTSFEYIKPLNDSNITRIKVNYDHLEKSVAVIGSFYALHNGYLPR